MTLPSKKIMFIAVACIIAVTGIYLSSKSTLGQTKEISAIQVTPQIVLSESIKNTSNTDSDSDGLKDWEEILWKTDPFKKDTDNDGIDDAKEVEKERSAMSGGIFTSTSGTSGIQNSYGTQKQTTQPQNLTLTEKLAQNAFIEYARLKQEGIPITPEVTEQLAQTILNSTDLNHTVATFSKGNLSHIIDAESNAVIHAYGNDVWNIMMKHTPKNTPLENEYIILMNAIQMQDSTELKKLDPIITGYTNTITEMLGMNVPRSAVTVHLDLLNKMNTILAIIEDMRVYFEDSIRGYGAIAYYGENARALQTSFHALVSYIQSKNAVYVEGEGGYQLLHSI